MTHLIARSSRSVRMELLEDRRLLSNPGLIQSTAALSSPRVWLAAGSAANTVLFAGGSHQFAVKSTVDLYNTKSHQWSQGSLSLARDELGGASVDSNVVFAGGTAQTNPAQTPVVDVFHGQNGLWSTTTMPKAVFPSAVSLDGFAIFVGINLADQHSYAEIYDVRANRWTSTRMPDGAAGPGIALANRAYFSYTDRSLLDYDSNSGKWSTIPLPRGMSVGTLATVGTKLIVVGYSSANVALYDTVTGQWSFTTMSTGRLNVMTATLGSKVIVAGGVHGSVDAAPSARVDVADVYDSLTGQWSVMHLSVARDAGAATTWGNEAFFAGGETGYGTGSTAVDIFTDTAPTAMLNGSIHRGARGSLSVSLKNAGDADLPSGYTVKVYAYAGSTVGSRNFLLGSAELASSTVPGGMSNLQIVPTLPSDLDQGSYNLIAAAVPPGRGHAVLFASQLDAFTLRAPRAAHGGALRLPAMPAAHPPVFSTVALADRTDDALFASDQGVLT